eukprot:6081827-Pyramimonas_sp.AAC.1
MVVPIDTAAHVFLALALAALEPCWDRVPERALLLVAVLLADRQLADRKARDDHDLGRLH